MARESWLSGTITRQLWPSSSTSTERTSAGESAEALAFARQRVLEELEEKRRSQRERERGSAALCFSGAALVVILLL